MYNTKFAKIPLQALIFLLLTGLTGCGSGMGLDCYSCQDGGASISGLRDTITVSSNKTVQLKGKITSTNRINHISIKAQYSIFVFGGEFLNTIYDTLLIPKTKIKEFDLANIAAVKVSDTLCNGNYPVKIEIQTDSGGNSFNTVIKIELSTNCEEKFSHFGSVQMFLNSKMHQFLDLDNPKPLIMESLGPNVDIVLTHSESTFVIETPYNFVKKNPSLAPNKYALTEFVSFEKRNPYQGQLPFESIRGDWERNNIKEGEIFRDSLQYIILTDKGNLCKFEKIQSAGGDLQFNFICSKKPISKGSQKLSSIDFPASSFYSFRIRELRVVNLLTAQNSMSNDWIKYRSKDTISDFYIVLDTLHSPFHLRDGGKLAFNPDIKRSTQFILLPNTTNFNTLAKIEDLDKFWDSVESKSKIPIKDQHIILMKTAFNDYAYIRKYFILNEEPRLELIIPKEQYANPRELSYAK